MPTHEQWLQASCDLIKEGRYTPAVRILDGLISTMPDDPVAYYLAGGVHLQKDMTGIGRVLLERAVTIAPEMAVAWHDLGIARRRCEDYDGSRAAFEKAHTLEPQRVDTLAMLAGCYVNVGDPAPGVEWSQKALDIDPNEPHALNHMALCLLELGKYREAWPYWEKRWRHPDRAMHARSYGASTPKWNGEELDGTLAIHGEQGLGDEIMYMSLLSQVKAKRIVIECADRLVPLFKRSFGWKCYPNHEALVESEEVDAWIPMGDLPMLLAPDGPIPATRYLKPSIGAVSKMHDYLKSLGPRPWVGVAWYGGLAKTQAGIRNPPPQEFDWLLNHAGLDCTFVSAQYDSEAADEDAACLGIRHEGAIAEDFEALTALIDACDVVVSVLQTGVHQAGGLGKRCLVPTPICTSWPFQLSGPMPWYESVELYRQADRGNWRPAFEQIAEQLRGLKQEKAA